MLLDIEHLNELPKKELERLIEAQTHAKLEHGFFVPENFATLTSENETILFFIDPKTDEVQKVSIQKNLDKIVLESSLFMTCGVAGFEFHGYKFLAHATNPDFLLKLVRAATNPLLQNADLKEDEKVQVQITTDEKGEMVLKEYHPQTHQDYLKEHVSNTIQINHRYLDGRSTVTSNPTVILEYKEREQKGLSWEERIEAMQTEYALLAEQFLLVESLTPDFIGELWNLYLKKNNLDYKVYGIDTFAVSFSSQMFTGVSAESFPDFMRKK